jgi:hypothetical protein
MDTKTFVTALIAGIVNLVALILGFVMPGNTALVELVQQLGDGITIIAVAIIVYVNRANAKNLLDADKNGKINLADLKAILKGIV